MLTWGRMTTSGCWDNEDAGIDGADVHRVQVKAEPTKAKVLDPEKAFCNESDADGVACDRPGGSETVDGMADDLDEKENSVHQSVRFPVDQGLNNKVKLFRGERSEYVELKVDAIVNLTNERMTDWSGLSSIILERAGPTLAEECRLLDTHCQTGDAKVTRGCLLNATHVIHTVEPRYTEQFANAAGNTLHNCYRNVLTQAKERRLRSLALPCIYTKKKGYPREKGCHIAGRALRCFMDKFGDDFEEIVLFLESDKDFELYRDTLSVYFPRNREEETYAKKELQNVDLDDWGQEIQKDRQIRISAMPGAAAASVLVPRRPAPPRPTSPKKQEYHEVVFGVDTFSDNSSYSAMLVRANEEENLKDMVALNIFYESGTDHKGRSILIFVAAKLASPGLNLDRLLLHMIKTADGLVLNPRGYVLVYLDHTCSIDYLPSISWLKALYDDVLGRKYKKNIQAMYIVHPTWQLKALFWGAMPFISSKFWEKHHYVDTLSELYTFIPSERVLLPKIAYHTDKQAVEELNSSFF